MKSMSTVLGSGGLIDSYERIENLVNQCQQNIKQHHEALSSASILTLGYLWSTIMFVIRVASLS